MKTTALLITAFTLIPGIQLFAQESGTRGKIDFDTVAVDLIGQFDTDKSNALNQLELSDAITHLQENRPFRKMNRPSTGNRNIIPNPPRVAVNLIQGYDSDDDVQLTRDELSKAIKGLRVNSVRARRNALTNQES